jgi:hypothetical protein
MGISHLSTVLNDVNFKLAKRTARYEGLRGHIHVWTDGLLGLQTLDTLQSGTVFQDTESYFKVLKT